MASATNNNNQERRNDEERRFENDLTRWYDETAVAFWCMGVLSNTPYVLVLAVAKYISQGGTAMVLIANCAPALCVKLSAPYWFDRVSYKSRIVSCSVLMVLGFSTVAISSSVSMQLVGVAILSTQTGLGEASLLALGGMFDFGREKNVCLTAFSSGTGMAGVIGFFWKFFFANWLGLGLDMTLWLANSMAVAYSMIYIKLIWHQEIIRQNYAGHLPEKDKDDDDDGCCLEHGLELNDTGLDESSKQQGNCLGDSLEEKTSSVLRIDEMSVSQRFLLVLSLYPYLIPLFVVYVAEFSLISGTWSAIGFPVTSLEARRRFYENSNWMYQLGVLVSRSSGTLFLAPMWLLWLMPALQCCNVVFFWWVAADQWFYNRILYVFALGVGLLGGAVYIQGYSRICADLPLPHREFAISTTSVAEASGILLAGILALFIQSCLYSIHNLSGAVVSCPF